MFRRSFVVSFLSLSSIVGAAAAQESEPPKIISWSNTKTADQKTAFQVKTGQKVTFTIVKAAGAEKYLWLVDGAIQEKVEGASFTWTVPDNKGMWKILAKTTNSATEQAVKERAAGWDKWLAAQEHGRKFPKENEKFVRDMTDLYVYPAQARKEWTVSTFSTTVKPGQSIQKAIDSLPPEGGIVELVPGVHEITDKMYPPGSRTIKYWSTYTLHYSIIIKRNNVIITGGRDSIVRQHENKGRICFYILGLEAPVTNVTFTGFTTASTYGRRYRGRMCMIAAHFVKNFTVSNMHDTSWAMSFASSSIGDYPKGARQYSQDVTIKNNTLEHTGVGVSRTHNIRVLNNTILGSRACNAIATDHAIKYMYVIGNRVINAGMNSGILVDKPVHCLVGDNFVRNRQKGIRSNNSGRQTIIENNTLTGASYAGIWITCQPKMPESLIRNNLIYNNRDGVYTSPEFRGRKQYTHIRLTNNVICNNKRDGIRTGAMEVSMIVSNNIIANNKGYGINYTVKGPLTLGYNNLWNNGQGNYNGISAGPGDFSKDPLFADPSKRDFYLKSKAGRWDPKAKKWVKDNLTSPCIDAGDPKADFSKEPAPNGGRLNIGAYGNTTEASKNIKK